MSINRSQGPGVSFWDGEMVIQEHESIQMVLKKNTHSTEHLKGTKQGKMILTNYRMIFKAKSSKDMLQELSMPFKHIKDFEIKQPVFGANYLVGRLVAEAQGGWEGSVVFEISFKAGGAIELGQKLVELATRPPQPMYMAASIHFAQCAPFQYGPGGSSPQQHYIPGAPIDHNYPQMHPAPYPPMYQPPQQPYQQPYPPQYTNPSYPAQQQQQGGTNLPPEYDPYQTPPPYKPNN